MATFNQNSFWKQFEAAPVGTIFRHPERGYLMKTDITTLRNGRTKQELNTHLAEKLDKRWAPATLR